MHAFCLLQLSPERSASAGLHWSNIGNRHMTEVLYLFPTGNAALKKDQLKWSFSYSPSIFWQKSQGYNNDSLGPVRFGGFFQEIAREFKKDRVSGNLWGNILKWTHEGIKYPWKVSCDYSIDLHFHVIHFEVLRLQQLFVQLSLPRAKFTGVWVNLWQSTAICTVKVLGLLSCIMSQRLFHCFNSHFKFSTPIVNETA